MTGGRTQDFKVGLKFLIQGYYFRASYDSERSYLHNIVEFLEKRDRRGAVDRRFFSDADSKEIKKNIFVISISVSEIDTDFFVKPI